MEDCHQNFGVDSGHALIQLEPKLRESRTVGSFDIVPILIILKIVKILNQP